jgi:phage shock protein PspC (stress-responsive transcriptional regulator)
MKKVININFHGRVIPIEETAYDILKQYVESLRRYFANEEGRDEIINDIEGRIAELFSERLKSGATCITDAHVNAIIASMGRPEDFEAEEAETSTSTSAGSKSQQSSSSGGSSSAGAAYTTRPTGRGRLYRNADDKILGGVASGLANYLGIDPVVMRIIFVLLAAPLFWVYILMWIILPSQSIQSNITKRLYRSEDEKVIGGVCGGLAAYFNISIWVPRLIFALPLIIGIISGPFNWMWDDWDFFHGPRMITGSLSTTLFVTYIILWITLPIATTAAEKLEMRGEKVDLNSIRDTVKGDLENFKSKAQNWGEEVKQTAQQFGERAREFGQTASTHAKTFSAEAGPIARGAGSGFGHAIGVLFKAFFLFIAAIIILALFSAFMGILFGGYVFFPLSNFVLDGFGQQLLAWASVILFLGIPLIALITWLIRRIMGVRTRAHYLGYVFGSLWFVGLVCVILLIGMVGRNFKRQSPVTENVSLVQPSNNKLYLDVVPNNLHYYGDDWFGIHWDEDAPFYGVNDDTIMLNTVRVDIVKTNAPAYRVTLVKLSRGNNAHAAKALAEKISFNVTQHDSVLLLPKGFAISQHEKWRNQQVMVVIEVPVGKRIMLDRRVEDYAWFNVQYNRRGGFDFDDDWDRRYWIQPGVEYIMTADGPKKVSELEEEELKERNNNNNDDDSIKGYRYRRNREENKAVDTLKKTVVLRTVTNSEAAAEDAFMSCALAKNSAEVSSPLSTVSRLFQ